MQPQPLSRKAPNAGLTIAPNQIPADHPLLGLVGKAIALYSFADSKWPNVLAAMSKSESHSFVITYHAIQNPRTKVDVIRALGKEKLNDDDSDIFHAVLNWYQSAKKKRDAIAHYIYAYSNELPGQLILIDPSKFDDEFSRHGLGSVSADRDYSYVYDEACLIEIVDEFSALSNIIGALFGYLLCRREQLEDQNPQILERLRRTLFDEPRIQEPLRRIRQRR